MTIDVQPVLTTVLSRTAVAIAKARHLPYGKDRAARLWGLGLQRHGIPAVFSWGFRDVPKEVSSSLATRHTHREMSGQVIEFEGRQYFVVFHHTAEHCAIIADCLKRNEPYLSLVQVNYLLLPDRRS